MTENDQLNALLVRNIGDIEAAVRHTADVVDKRLWEEAADQVGDILDEAWFTKLNVDETEVLFAKLSWLDPEKPDQPNAKIWLDERLETESDFTWLAEFLAAGPKSGKVALFFDQNLITKAQWKKHLKERLDVIGKLNDNGFIYDGSDGALFLPVVLNRETLAKAFEKDDFTEALTPLSDALRAVVTSAELLDQLVAEAREAAA